MVTIGSLDLYVPFAQRLHSCVKDGSLSLSVSVSGMSVNTKRPNRSRALPLGLMLPLSGMQIFVAWGEKLLTNFCTVWAYI